MAIIELQLFVLSGLSHFVFYVEPRSPAMAKQPRVNRDKCLRAHPNPFKLVYEFSCISSQLTQLIHSLEELVQTRLVSLPSHSTIARPTTPNTYNHNHKPHNHKSVNSAGQHVVKIQNLQISALYYIVSSP